MGDTQLQAEEQPVSAHKSQRLMAYNVLAILAIFYTLYLAQTLFIPLVLTILLALLLSPLVAVFKRVHIPRVISALVLLTCLITPFSFLGIQLAEPVQKWAQLLPELSAELNEQIDSIHHVIQGDEQAPQQAVQPKEESGFSFFGLFKDEPEPEQVQPAAVEENIVTTRLKQGGIEVLLSMLAATPLVLAQIATGLVLILFLLIFGPGLFEAYVKGLNNNRDKHQVVTLVNVIQSELSRYILTISIINIGLGACTALSLKLLGVEDALLWGVLAGLLNFIPYVGSVMGLAILSLAGITQYGMHLNALLVPSIYLLLNIIESQFITPTILGRNMRLNPLIIMLWLILCGWLWGAVGVLLAVPLLVCIKLIIGQLGIWPQWIAMMESEG